MGLREKHWQTFNMGRPTLLAEDRVRNLTDYHLIEIQVAKQCNVDNRTAALWRRVWVGLSLGRFT